MKPVKMRSAAILAALLLPLFAYGCAKDSAGIAAPNSAKVRVLLRDDASDYIAAAKVAIGAVELISADGQNVTLSEDGTNGYMNLLDFQAPAAKLIADANIDPGTFTQMRLIVDSARVELASGYTFKDGSTEMDLKIPSGMQTGIKLNLQDTDGNPLSIVPGETVLVLDFDVSKSFVLQGNFETPAGVHGVIFKPTISVTGQNIAASISGTVSTSLDGVSVDGLTVTATPQTEGANAITTTTASDGSYTIPGVPPGSYVVTVAVGDGQVTTPLSIAVNPGNSENVTGVDFEIIESASISGTVSTSLDGVSVDGLTVTATADGEPSVTTQTASGGTYEFQALPAGTWTITVTVGDGYATSPASLEVDLAAGEPSTGADFEVVSSG